MEVTARHTPTGRECSVQVSDTDTVLALKTAALTTLFGDATAATAATTTTTHLPGDADILDDATPLSDTSLANGGRVELRGGGGVRVPAVYAAGKGPLCVAVSPAGDLCAVGHAKSVSVWHTGTGDPVSDIHTGSATLAIAWSPCGTQLATTASRSRLSLLHVGSGALSHTTTPHRGPILSHAWSPCGAWIVTAGADGNLVIWDAEHARPAHTLRVDSCEAAAVAVSPHGIAATGGPEGVVRLWELSSGDCTAEIEAESAVRALGFSSDASRLIGVHSLELSVWDVAAKACLRTVPLSARCGPHVAFAPQGDVVAVCDEHQVNLRLYSVTEGTPLPLIGASHTEGIALSPCGRWVFAANRKETSVHRVEGL